MKTIKIFIIVIFSYFLQSCNKDYNCNKFFEDQRKLYEDIESSLENHNKKKYEKWSSKLNNLYEDCNRTDGQLPPYDIAIKVYDETGTFTFYW